MCSRKQYKTVKCVNYFLRICLFHWHDFDWAYETLSLTKEKQVSKSNKFTPMIQPKNKNVQCVLQNGNWLKLGWNFWNSTSGKGSTIITYIKFNIFFYNPTQKQYFDNPKNSHWGVLTYF